MTTTATFDQAPAGTATGDLAQRAERVAQVAAQAAADVDAQARFPAEALSAARRERLLGALVPRELGGLGAGICEVGETIATIARQCASSAMVLAMHHLQVACLVRHGHTPALRSQLADVAESQLLLASATTEAQIGGALRHSSCFLETNGDRFRLEKQAPVISYGAHADAVLATARRHADAAPGDQVLVLCLAEHTELEETSGWDTVGLRGTCSSGFHLVATGESDHVLPVPFADIAAQTMLPASHVLWGYVWLGLAAGAVEKARTFIQAEARRKPGTTPHGAGSFAELVVVWGELESLVRSHAARYDARFDGDATEPGLSDTIASNALKVAASRLVVDVVGRSLTICGIAGYKEDSPFCLGRQLRDAHGAAVMVNNDRILADNAQLLLVHRGAW